MPITGPTEDQRKAIKNLGQDPAEFDTIPRSKITAYLKGEFSRNKQYDQVGAQRAKEKREERLLELGLVVGKRIVRKSYSRLDKNGKRKTVLITDVVKSITEDARVHVEFVTDPIPLSDIIRVLT